MNTASKNQARDLEADLAICEAATPGPYEQRDLYVTAKMGANEVAISICYTPSVARFIAEAREGWPYAIHRALAAEREIDRLRAENAMLLEALNQRGCGL